MNALAPYIPIAQSIAALLHPHAEVVLHELEGQTIAAIFNNFSARKVGDPSLLEQEADLKNFPDYFEPYYKTNWDGQKLKSTTATLRDDQGKPIGLLCINLDITMLTDLRQLIDRFVQPKQAKLPRELFEDDWREKISLFVHSYLEQKGKTLSKLTKEEKRKLVFDLYREGAFRAKHAAAHVGLVLKLSRATVYNYLAEMEK
ncbi:MAG: PAS domain-containing protein [Parachlamydia sp.]|nr:PAS domain-containing protein [Parachlamydia sp.]